MKDDSQQNKKQQLHDNRKTVIHKTATMLRRQEKLMVLREGREDFSYTSDWIEYSILLISQKFRQDTGYR